MILYESPYVTVIKDEHCVVKKIKNTIHGMAIEAMQEIAILQQLQHPLIVKLITVNYESKTTNLFLETADMDLRWYIDLYGYNKSMFLQLVEAVRICHQFGIIHRDIKPRNVLVSLPMTIKLADFGSSIMQWNIKKSHNCTTLWYRAPEILLKQNYNHLIDVWSLGCVWYEWMSKTVLFQGLHAAHQLTLQQQHIAICEFDKEINDIMNHMITLNNRVSVDTLFTFSYFDA